MSAFRRLPVRTRLAVVSAGVTFGVLALFAVGVGAFGERQVRSNFDDELRATAANLQDRLVRVRRERAFVDSDSRAVDRATAGGGAIRVLVPGEDPIHTPDAPPLGRPRLGVHDSGGYRVAARQVVTPSGKRAAFLQYAKPRERTDHTVARIWAFAAMGVLGGTLLAFLTGMTLFRRTMRPAE